MKYYLVIKSNKSDLKNWLSLKIIILKERTQCWKVTCSVNPFNDTLKGRELHGQRPSLSAVSNSLEDAISNRVF